MNDNNNLDLNSNENTTVPILDDIEYDSESSKKNAPVGVSAPVLDDIDYVAPTAKKGGPEGVTAPVLDDVDSYVPHEKSKKGAPENVTAPILDDNDYTAKPTVNNDEAAIIAEFSPQQKEMYDKLSPDKQKQIIDMRKAQLSQKKDADIPKNIAEPITAPKLDNNDDYTPTAKETQAPKENISAPILDDEPEKPKYVPKFVDEDLERAKKEGAKRSVSSQLTSSQKDEKESLKMMLELKAEREAEGAKKGFKITIMLAFVGIAAAVLFYLFYSGLFFGLSYQEGASKFQQIMADYSLYFSIAVGVVSLLIITGINGFKSLTSFIFFLFSIIQVFPGFFIIAQKNGSDALNIILYIATLLCSIAVFATLSASESVGLFFKKPAKDYR